LKVLVTDNKFNKYCVDCMKDRTTYLITNYGIFVCENCAFQHYRNFPQQKHYLKHLYTEVFDPYQIKVLEFAGNKNFFELLKEYKVEKESFAVKYSHPVAKWYKKQFKAKCCNVGFFEKKPPL